MTPKEILIKARDIITDPEHWTQRQLARTREQLKGLEPGRTTKPCDADAVCFCSIGALYRAGNINPSTGVWLADKADGVVYKAGVLLARQCPARVYETPEEDPDTMIWTFNDDTDHASILAAYDRAIEAAD